MSDFRGKLASAIMRDFLGGLRNTPLVPRDTIEDMAKRAVDYTDILIAALEDDTTAPVPQDPQSDDGMTRAPALAQYLIQRARDLRGRVDPWMVNDLFAAVIGDDPHWRLEYTPEPADEAPQSTASKLLELRVLREVASMLEGELFGTVPSAKLYDFWAEAKKRIDVIRGTTVVWYDDSNPPKL